MSDTCRCINCKHGNFFAMGAKYLPQKKALRYVGTCTAKGIRTTQNAHCPQFDEK